MGTPLVPLSECSFEGIPTRRFALSEQLKVLRAHGFRISGSSMYFPTVFPPWLHEKFYRQSCWLSSQLERVLPKFAQDWLSTAFIVAAVSTV